MGKPPSERESYTRKIGTIELYASEIEDLILAIENRQALVGSDPNLIYLKLKLRKKLTEIKPKSPLANRD